MNYKTICCFIFVFCVLHVQAFAMPDNFAKMDTNSDGKISLEEFKSAFPTMHDAAFTTIDSNGDKAIERSEWEAFTKNHAAGMKPGNMPKGQMPAPDSAPSHNHSERPLITPPNQSK